MLKAGLATQTEGPGKAHGPRFVPPPVGEIARLFPQLEILRLIGQGGMGAVYKARQPALDRFVALKVLPPATAGDPGFAERFNREARALARLNHPNIVAVHDFGKAGTLHYLVMEFVDGANLREVERLGELTPERALAVVPQICEALQFAHNEGIVHRDIKPENLLLDKKGRVKITDFGIAKMVGVGAGPQNLTGAKDVVGTPHYMAPEQIEKPLSVDHRADIYSLGVVFYEMLTGELPLGKFAPPSKKVQIDVRLDEVVLHTLEKEPNLRYQQASQVKTAVETIVSTPSPGKNQGRSASIGALSFRRGMWAGFVCFLLMTAIATIVTMLLPRDYEGVALVRLTGPEPADPYRLQTEAEIIQSQPVLEPVAASLNLSQRWGQKFAGGEALSDDQTVGLMKRRIDVQPRLNTALVEIRFHSDSPAEAAEIANKIVETYCALPPPVRANITERAMVPSYPIRPNVPLNIFLGVVCGGILGIFAGVLAGLFSFWRGRTEPHEPLPAILQSAVESWLAQMDNGDYEQSWDTAAPYFQRVITKEDWIGRLKKARHPLGPVIYRKFTSSRFDVSGTRLVVKFATAFDGLPAATETVTFAKQAGGEWRAMGYLVRPAGFQERTSLGSPATLPATSFSKVFGWIWILIFAGYFFLLLNDHFGIHNSTAWDYFNWCFLGFTVVSAVELLVRLRRARNLKSSEELRPLNKSLLKVMLASAVIALVLGVYFGLLRNHQSSSIKSDYLSQARLQTKVKYAAKQASVQDIVQNLAEQAGLKYDWQKSFDQTDPLCRQWVRNVSIEGETCQQALNQILNPVGLRYQVENGVLVLSRQDEGPTKSDYIGQGWFPLGDSIEITSVVRMSDQMVVKGRYNLVSHDQASLALYITSTNQSGFPENVKQTTIISQGHGDFELVHPHLVSGLPHVSMYADGHPFASLYFGTQTEALEESKAGWITNTSSASALQFRLVLPQDSTEPADWLPSTSGSERLHLSRQVLLDDTAIAQAGVDFDPLGGRMIEIRFTDAGAKEFEAITATNIGHQLAIVFRGQVLSAPVIQSVIPSGECQVNGSMSASEIDQIVDHLNPTAMPTSKAWNFSPVQERILFFNSQPNALFGWLDLDSGMVLTNSMLDWQSRSSYDWIHNHDLDVVTTQSAKHIPTLLGFDMIVASAPTNGWDMVTPADVIHDWPLLQEEPQQKKVLSAIPGQTDTFIFQTREGGKGILQILGFAENPPGVKIRYKLVQATKSSIAIDPATGLPAGQQNVRIDPNTGLPLPTGATNIAIDPATGLPTSTGKSGAIDPVTGIPVAPAPTKGR
jgi:serine/threonine protein kinase